MSEPNNYSSWEDDEIAKLKELYAKGLTNGQIAAQLRGKSRNAVIGKVARLVARGALKHRGGNEVAAIHAIKAASRRTIAAAPMPREEAAPATARPWLTRLEGECRAPIGEPNADMLMCCARAGRGTNGDYCERHAARLFKTTPRQEDERLARRFA